MPSDKFPPKNDSLFQNQQKLYFIPRVILYFL